MGKDNPKAIRRQIALIKTDKKMTKRYVSLLIICFFATILIAQDNDPYVPRNLGEAVNTIYSEIKPVLSPDGKTLYFVRVDHPQNRFGTKGSQEVWVSYLQEDGYWSEAERMPSQINIGRYNAVLSVTDDGKTLLINGIYNKKGNTWKKRGFSLVKMGNSSWGIPEPVKIDGYDQMSKGLNNDAFLSANGKTLLLSFGKKRNKKNQSLYYSNLKPNGNWSRPQPLENLNSKFSDEAPFLSADNRVIYFSSNRRSKINFDIYKSIRLNNHSWESWSAPELLSDTINSHYWESFFQTNHNGSMAYFSSTNGTQGRADIFQIKLYEENPYVVVTGKIINKTNNMPISSAVTYEILANSTKIDSLWLDHQNSEFRAVLPLGKSYSLMASANNHKSENVVIDASNLNEFTEVRKDLFLEPFDYIQLTGNIFLKNTNQKVPEDANPMFHINGRQSDIVQLDWSTGFYQVNLPFGKDYELAVQTTKYEAIPEKLDLKDVREFRQIIKNLFVEEQKTASIVGKIFDRKTGKSFPAETPVRIEIDGSPVMVTQIDSLTREYRLELALGKNYTISAAAENYYPVTEIIDVANEREKVRIYKDLYLVPIEIGQAVRLNNIFFETGKAVLMPESFTELDRVVKFLTDNPSIKIEIGGHTDNVGSAALNNDLSNRRAKAVTEYIMLKGIPANAISSKGYGFSKPVASNATADGKQLNRRVEFTIVGK
jgi:outer membrane protein OmpA-like peptidoglycan-associated protein